MGAQESRRGASADDGTTNEAAPDYYELLGIEETATQDEIKVNLADYRMDQVRF